MADKETAPVTMAYMDQIFTALREKMDELSEKIDELSTKAASTPRARSSGKRKPSKYNLFIKKCMKGTGKPMATCAAEYKTAKADGTLDAQIANVQGMEEEE